MVDGIAIIIENRRKTHWMRRKLAKKEPCNSDPCERLIIWPPKVCSTK
jgi:hypothetical protein